MSAKRVLVTGATGFTGSHLAERLAREGHVVRALVRDPARSVHLRDCGVEPALGDLRLGFQPKTDLKGGIANPLQSIRS